MNKEIIAFINNYTEEIKEQNAAIFVGAGMSIPAGYVNWLELLKPLAEELGIDIDRENDLVALAQYYCNDKGGNRSRINKLIFDEFGKSVKITDNHKILSRLPIVTFWTTNYDSLVEDALKNEGKIPDVKYTIDQLAVTKSRRDAIVYKMHGDREHSSKAIIIKDDYEAYHINFAPFITALSGDLVSKTFLFIGLSFTDPNIDYILSRVRINYNLNQRTHYCFIKKVNNDEFKINEDYLYFKRKQELFTQDLKRFNIQTLIIEEYSEITEILLIIEKKINMKNIFISGSAHSYEPWQKSKVESFINKLSKLLIQKDYNIISGFGLGIGSLIITGALEEIYMNQGRIDDSRLLLRPFPQNIKSNIERKELWKRYREDMISRAGISIFLFGNKEKDNNIVEADGVYSEFKIACKMNNKIIPVGSTHWVARKIWEEVNEDFDSFYPNATSKLKTLFVKLNKDDISVKELIQTILNFINELNKEERNG